jgi:hypothetical protein
MPTSQLTAFEESLNGLKSCSSLDEPTLVRSRLPALPVPPVCRAVGADPGGQPPAQAGRRSGQLLANWQQTLLENLEDPFTQDSLGLLPPASKKLIDAFLVSRKLPDPMTTEFANAVQEALSGLEKIAVKGDEIKQALLQGGSPATPDDPAQALRHIYERALQGQGFYQAALRDRVTRRDHPTMTTGI